MADYWSTGKISVGPVFLELKNQVSVSGSQGMYMICVQKVDFVFFTWGYISNLRGSGSNGKLLAPACPSHWLVSQFRPFFLYNCIIFFLGSLSEKPENIHPTPKLCLKYKERL